MSPRPWGRHADTWQILDKQMQADDATVHYTEEEEHVRKADMLQLYAFHLDLASEVSDFCTVLAIQALTVWGKV